MISMCVLANSAEALARQNCATILHRREAARSTAVSTAVSVGGLSFKCKSCDRAFETFQALGGHRASHKKLRLESGDSPTHRNQGGGLVAPAERLKIHECRECRIGFPTGQALGGHMRKHVDLNAKRKRVEEEEHENALEDEKKRIQAVPFLSESKIVMRKRVCLNLDLNFPPPLEDYSGFLQLV